MTSLIDNSAPILTPSTAIRHLRVDKNGFPLTKQIGRLSQLFTGIAPATIVPDGSSVIYVPDALAGVLTIDCTDYKKLAGKTLNIMVRPGPGQNVVVNFPASGYTVYVKGAAAAVTSYTIAASANAQSIFIDFRTDGAFIVP